MSRRQPWASWIAAWGLVAASAPVQAQTPRPLAEGASVPLLGTLGAVDAAAANRLAAVADELRRSPADGRQARVLVESLSRRLDGYCGAAAPATAMGSDGVDSARDDGSFLHYVWPQRADGEARLLFALTSDGRLLLAQNERGYEGESGPAVDAATGLGSRGRFEDVLPGPGKGADGSFWVTNELLQAQRRRVQVAVRADEGRPLASGQVAFLPPSWLDGPGVHRIGPPEALDVALPAVAAALDGQGRASLHGIAAQGLVACAGHDGLLLAVPARAVTITEAGVEVVVPLGLLREARIAANERAAIATLKNIGSAQAQCQACGVIDCNRNGRGEYGFFAELAGAVPVRSDGQGGVGTAKIQPPVLSAAFRNVENGRVARSGYLFQIFLPDADRRAVAEAKAGGAQGVAVDPAAAERFFCVYAWPLEAGASGRRAFFIDGHGDVLASPNATGRYSGHGGPPPPDAAFAIDGDGRLGSGNAANHEGRDGQVWKVVF